VPKMSGRARRKYIILALGMPVFLHLDIEGARTSKKREAAIVPPKRSINVELGCSELFMKQL